MPDETHSNLEPISEEDLEMHKKFSGGENKKEIEPENRSEETSVESTPAPEKTLERKESAVEKEESYSDVLSQVSQKQTTTQDEVVSDAEIIAKEKDAQSRIDNLVAIADSKGVAHAVKVARHMDDYILDEFHDRLLTDELHDALLARKMIKEI